MAGGSEIALWVLLLGATITDITKGKIYNFLTLPALILGLTYQFYVFGLSAAQSALGNVVLIFILFFPLWLAKVFAAGDVKLLMALAAWSDFKCILNLTAYAVLIGALVGVYLLLRHKGFKGGIKSVFNHLKMGAKKKSTRMPFAPAFLCGYLIIEIGKRYDWVLF